MNTDERFTCQNTLHVFLDGLSCGITRAQICMFSFFDALFVRGVPLSLVLDTTGESWAAGRASALYQLTPLVLPVHTNFYRT
jgi:hypothetical protein